MEIYLAGGCFWGVEKYFSRIEGVTATEVGYANGKTQNPTYEEVYTGTTGFAETVKITYNPAQISLTELLRKLYKIIDPTVKDRQGPDTGSQYRTGIFYTDPSERQTIANSLEELQKQYQDQVVTENLPLENYYKAEEYHQNYLYKNPDGYCHIPADKM
jgi:methionine-S-sulfoxide reductase